MPAEQRTQQPRLPHGRHGLERAFVAHHQLQRLLDAVATVVSESGYAAMTVDTITTTAGVSRRTFYANFDNKEQAYLAAFDEISSKLMWRVTAAFDASTSFTEGVIECMRVFLGLAAEEPRYASMCIVEVLAAGPAAIAKRNATMKTLVDVLNKGAKTVSESLQPPPLTAEIVIGGAYEVIYSRVLAGEATRLPELLPDLAYSVMLPYVGREAADRVLTEMRAGDNRSKR